MTTRRMLMVAVGMTFLPFVAGCSDDSSSQTGASWKGHTYLLNIPTTRWTEPQGAAEDISAYVPKFMFQVNSDAAGSAEILIGTSLDDVGTQDSCNPTTVVTAIANYPAMSIPATDVPIHVASKANGAAIIGKAYGLTATDILPEGEGPGNVGTFSATVDARELYPLFHMIKEPSADAVCSALASVKANCAACPSDGAVYCLTLKAEHVGAANVPGLTVQPVSSTGLAATCIAAATPTGG